LAGTVNDGVVFWRPTVKALVKVFVGRPLVKAFSDSNINSRWFSIFVTCAFDRRN